jgi:hypothetical protein
MATPIPPALADHPAMKLMSSLLAGQDDGGMEELFKQLGTQRETAQRDATAAGGALAQAQNAPIPQPNPAIASILTALGQAASSAGQNTAGTETATKLQEDDRKLLMAKRSENLARLSEAYKRAADRAERIGDLENEIKLRSKMETVMENRRTMHEQAGRVAENDMAGAREQASDTRQATRERERDTRAKTAEMEKQTAVDTAAERRTWIAAGFDPDTHKPLPGAGGRYNGRTNPSLRWSSLNAMGDDYAKLVQQSKSKALGGLSTKVDKKELISRILNGSLPPPEEWRENPEAYARYLASLTDPEHPDRLLFKVDPKSGKSIYDQRIQALVKQYYQDVEF